jgi:hypothetical protein
MKKKKTDLEKQLEGEKGFTDIVSLLDGDAEEEELARRKHASLKFQDDKLKQNLVIQDFLEYEKLRLEKLDSFYSKKVPNLIQFPQIEHLLAKQEEELNELRSDLVKTLSPATSPFNQRMKTIFNKAF